MLKKLSVQNFRSIEDCDVAFGPITVFFGPTSTGKSTLFYALLVLRNFILNPNQALDGLFNLGFQDLGGFDACIFDHGVSKTLGVTAQFGDRRSYGVHFRKADAEIVQASEFFPMKVNVSIPYGANQSWPFAYAEAEELINIGAYARGSNPDCDVAIAMKPAIDQFLQQKTEENADYATTCKTLLELAEASEREYAARVKAAMAPSARSAPQG